ncbi:MAG: methyl-accepting chemotaxis protein [Prochloraceae cyanobacterium]
MSNQFNRSSSAYEQEESIEERDLPHNSSRSDSSSYKQKSPSSLLSYSEIQLAPPETLKTVSQENHNQKMSAFSNKISSLEWFYNLPIRSKQSLALLASQVLPVAGIVGIGIFLISGGGQSKITQRTKLEAGDREVYIRKPDGTFTLATDLKLTANSSLVTTGIVALVLAGAALGLTAFLAYIQRLAIVLPLQQLQLAANQFTTGDRQVRAEVFAADEVGKLTLVFNQLADQLVAVEAAIAAEVQQSRLLEELASASNSQRLESSLNKLLAKVRHNLQADRTLIYKFDTNSWQGEIIAESVAPGFKRTVGKEIQDPGLAQKYADNYQQGVTRALNNIYEEGLGEFQLKQLESFAVKACLIVPIISDGELFGLAIAHQCSQTRTWQQNEIEYFNQFASQIGLALNSFLSLEEKREEAARERQQKEEIQKELLQLVNDVEIASLGDLTVEAEINGSSQMSIVASGFNEIVASLRKIVIEIEQATATINTSVGKNEQGIRQLANEALKQITEINQGLNSVEQMNLSIQEVSKNAREAAKVARTTATTAQTGGEAMARAVESILQLQATVGETANKVKRLGQSSQQISKAISLINQIALKTKVLAVNAGIEAGRAGEEGQGFVVVAEEVGKLATQSAAATKEIEQIVANIQLETNDLAKGMKIGTAQVVEGARLVEQTKGSLAQLVQVSTKMDRLVQSISTSTISQAQTSQKVTNLMQEVAELAQQTCAFSDRVSTSLHQTVEVAQQLQESASSFKIE